MDAKDRFVGDEAWSKREILHIKAGIDRGHFADFDNLEILWHHSFYNELCITPEEHPFLFAYAEFPSTPKNHRIEMTKIMFETFNTPGIFIAPPQSLALFASGRSTGVVLDVGGGVSCAMSVYEGHPISHAVEMMPLGGNDVSAYLGHLCGMENEGFLNVDGKFTICDSYYSQVSQIKKLACCVHHGEEDFEEALLRSEALGDCQKEVELKLPDSRNKVKVMVGAECFRAPEILLSGDVG